MPTTTSVYRSTWPEVCPIRWCSDPIKPGHHHHEQLYSVNHQACTCVDHMLHIPGTRPRTEGDGHINEAGLKMLILGIIDEDYAESGGRNPTRVTDNILSLVKPYLRFDEYGDLTEKESE
jgi:hypothetical protein